MNDKSSSDKELSNAGTENADGEANEKEGKPNEPTPPPVSESVNTDAEQPHANEAKIETDEKQDQSIALLAEQTSWIAKQTKWIKYQVIVASALTIVTLGVLIYHGVIMQTQSQAAINQTAIMKSQLEAMNSGSSQTQEMIAAMQKQADAASAQAGTSQALAEQNQDLVEATLAQADAAKQQAQIAQQSFYIGDRPYLSANALLDNEFEMRKIPNIRIMIQNYGKTPALDFQVGAMVSVRDLPDPDPGIFRGMSESAWEEISAENMKQLPYARFAPEGAKSFLPADGKSVSEIHGPELTASLIEDIKTLRKFLVVWGFAPYKDGLGRRHLLKFCLFYNATDDMFVACPTFNSTN